MKYCLGGSYLVMKITPRVPEDRNLIAIGYQYNSHKSLGFIATKGDGIYDTGDTYLSHLPGNYYDVSIIHVVHPHELGRYFNAQNAIEKHNNIHKYDQVLEKYLVTQS